MRRPGDMWRQGGGSNRRRFGIGAVVGLLFLLFSFFRSASVFYTDFLWFDSVDFTSIWSSILFTKIALGAAAVAVFFVLLYVNLWVVDRLAPRSLMLGPEDELSRRFQSLVRPRAGRFRLIVAAAIALFSGMGFFQNWSDWILFRNGGSFGGRDPEFGMDPGFFVFKLPFITTALSWFFYAVVLALIVSLVAHFLQGAIRPQAPSNRITSGVKTHVSILLGVLALVRAGQYFVDRYRLNLSDRGVASGAFYTDVNFLRPALEVLVAISLVAAIVFFVGSRRRGWSLPVVTVASWGLVSVLIATVIPLGVQRFSVVPAESSKEAPYIQRNIEATRAATGLDKVQVQGFPYTDNLTGANLEANAQTIRNVRLWDPAYLKPSYQRLQENRSFFAFDDVDIDRYRLGSDELTQLELSVRELNVDGLPPERRSWVNRHLQFTHGYGAVASPANAVTADGKPQFTLKDLPPGGIPEIRQPQVYFGEQSAEYSIVGTKQAEVDFVSADGRDQTSRYAGSGGVRLDNVVKRAAFASRVNDVKPLISGLVTPQSKAMYITNIRERAQKAAPFLSLDNDPYPVITDGRIKWVNDAYTTSASFPYGQPTDTSQLERTSGLAGKQFNYVRNSVKIVTDAYDGTMTYYVTDPTDPVIKAYQKAFPKLFTDQREITPDLREHLRYPEDIFRIQSTMFGRYHLTNANDFYSQGDRWNIAQKPSSTASVSTQASTVPPQPVAPGMPPVQTVTGEQRIEPYYLLMRLPGEQEVSFLTFQPFVPYSARDERKELQAFMTAKSGPNNYGQMNAFVMPRDRQIDGPALVDARIQQDPAIAQQVTLLNQGGSRVDYGNMLIVPIDNGLLYVRPLYVTARQTQVPEFKKAIVVQGSKIAMEDTLQAALARVFGSAPVTLEENRQPGAGVSAPATPGPVPTPGTAAAPAGVQDLLRQANDSFGRADDALRAGDLARYQSEIRAGVDAVRRAQSQ